MKNKLIEEFIIALSLSNLLFITSWRRLVYPTSESYHIKLEPYPLDFLGVLLSVILTAAVFYGGLWISRRINKSETPLLTKLIFLGFFVITLNGIRLQFFESESSFYVKIGLLVVSLLLGIIFFIKWREKLFILPKTFLLIVSPFIVFTFFQAISGFLTANPQSENTITSQIAEIKTKEKNNIKNRVVWIIFDELDYFVPFETNPSKVNLPEFTKLKNESLFATNAVSPAYTTIESIPSLLTGKIIKKSKTLGKNELAVSFEENKTAKFSEIPNVFQKVKEMNGETAVVGWYHSYCRVIGKDLSACQWESFDTVNDFEPIPLPRIIARNFLNCLISLPFGYRLFEQINLKIEGVVENSGYLKRHSRMMEDSKIVISEPRIDLALIHLPFPHTPSYYNKSTGEFSPSVTSYLDNLALSDKMFGELRKTLEDKGLWENSTIIVSSDHQWRLNNYQLKSSDKDFSLTNGTEHPNIPFFLKPKGQKESIIYEKPFNTVITHDLILAILKGEISTINEVKDWMDKNSN